MTSRAERIERVMGSLKESPQAVGKGVRILCPFCVSSKTNRPDYSMFLHGMTGRFRCFRCGTFGTLPGFEGVEELPYDDAAWDPPEGFYRITEEPAASSRALAPAREYLVGRGIGIDLLREAGVGACLRGRMRGRVVVPITDAGGVWRGYVGRDWSGLRERPYDYPPDMRRYELLYNPGALTDPEGVLVVEGVFDALALWPYAVALLGKPSQAQRDQLGTALGPVVVLLDGDAWEEGWALAMGLRLDGRRAGAIRLPPKVDPDEVDRELISQAAQACLDTTDAVCIGGQNG